MGKLGKQTFDRPSLAKEVRKVQKLLNDIHEEVNRMAAEGHKELRFEGMPEFEKIPQMLLTFRRQLRDAAQESRDAVEAETGDEPLTYEAMRAANMIRYLDPKDNEDIVIPAFDGFIEEPKNQSKSKSAARNRKKAANGK